MKKNKTIKIAELLPEGLSEASVNKIAELVQSHITEEVDAVKKELSAKVLGYLELQKNEIKEQALKELGEENQVFRDAELMKSFKSVMAIELNEQDRENAKSDIEDENSQLKEELSTLVVEMKKVLAENAKLSNTAKVLEQKNILLSKTGNKLGEKVKTLTEQVAKPFKSSEKAIVINNADKKPAEENDNPWLTEEVIKLTKNLIKE
jgi:hypothetical protein